MFKLLEKKIKKIVHNEFYALKNLEYKTEYLKKEYSKENKFILENEDYFESWRLSSVYDYKTKSNIIPFGELDISCLNDNFYKTDKWAVCENCGKLYKKPLYIRNDKKLKDLTCENCQIKGFLKLID